jgi:hypothetical protein
MKSKLLGLMASIVLLGLSPANATTYTYNVDFSVGGTTVTGTIATDCDSSCYLAASDIGLWSLTMDGTTYSSSTGGTLVALTAYPLEATTTNLIFDGTKDGYDRFMDGSVWELQFSGGEIDWFLNNTFQGEDDLDGDSLTVGTMATSATPLPAALPLFGTVLGIGGLLGWRRKRKNVAAVAAA